MRYQFEIVNLALKEPCNDCGASMKCYDGCRKGLHKQKHAVQAPIHDTWNGLDESSSWMEDEMVFPPLETFAQLFAFHLTLCNNDRRMARMFAKQQFEQQKKEKEMESVAKQETDDGWETVPAKKGKSKRGNGNWVR